MKKITTAILAVTLLMSIFLTGCSSTSSGDSQAPAVPSPSPIAPAPIEPSPPAPTNPPAAAAAEEEAPIDDEEPGPPTVIGPVSIVEESPLLDNLSAEDRDLFLRMNQTSIGNFFQKYDTDERWKFSNFLVSTMRIDFDRRIAERGLDLRYTEDTSDIVDLVENYRYLHALVLSCFWENHDGGLIYNHDLFQKYAVHTSAIYTTFPDALTQYPPSLTPEYNAENNTIEAPLVDPFSVTAYGYILTPNTANLARIIVGIEYYQQAIKDALANNRTHRVILNSTYYLELCVSIPSELIPVSYSRAELDMPKFDRYVASSTQINPFPDELVRYFD